MNVSELRPWEWEAADAEQLDRIREVQHAFREEHGFWRAHWKKVDRAHTEAVAAAGKLRGRRGR